MNSYFTSLPRALLAGFIIGTLLAIFSVSYAALIYNGPLAQYLIVGVSAGLIGSMIIAITLALFSSSPMDIGQCQSIFAVITAIVASGIAGKVSKINAVDVLPTIIAASMVMTILSGLMMLLLGELKKGKIVKYFPYPVIGGFLAGTGWLILVSTFSLLTSMPISLDNLSQLMSHEFIWRWSLPLAYAVVILLIRRRQTHYLVFPSLLVIPFVLFYGYIFFSGLSVSEALAHQLMMGPFPEGKLTSIPSLLLSTNHVQWGVIVEFLPEYLTLIIMVIISLLLNVSSYEVLAKQDMDINKELRITGFGNIIIGLLGGIGGYQSLALSKINIQLKSNTRLVGIISGCFTMLVLILGTPVLTFLPKCVFGILLLFIALDFMVEWLFDIKNKLSWPDYLIVVTIALAIAVKGLLIGVLIGLIMSLFLFSIHYSRIEVLRTIMTGSFMRSNVDRNGVEQALLEQEGHRLLIPVMSGYLFFGNASLIVQEIIQYVDNKEKMSVKYIIIDFSRITGMEVSYYLSFIKLLQFCRQNNITVVCADLLKKLS